MNKELQYKSIEFECKASTASNGGLTGHANTLYTVDRYGDVCTGYTGLENLVNDGFVTDTHGLPEGEMGDYTYKGQLGIINIAKPDATGLDVDISYHPDEDSQKIRAKVENRIDNHKSVFFSIGWRPAKPPIIINAANFKSMLPKYVPADKVNQIIEQAKDLPKIRLIEAEVREIALAPRPVDNRAFASSYKNMETTILFEGNNFKAEFLGEEIEDRISLAAIQMINDREMNALYNACIPGWGEGDDSEDEDKETADCMAIIDEAATLKKGIIQKMQELEASGTLTEEEKAEMLKKAVVENTEFKSGAKHSKSTVEKYKEVMDSCKSMQDKIKEHHKAMKEELGSIYDCMKDMSEPEEPEQNQVIDGKDNEESKAFLDSLEAQLIEHEYSSLLLQ